MHPSCSSGAALDEAGAWKCLMLSSRLAHSRTTAKASTSRSSRVSPFSKPVAELVRLGGELRAGQRAHGVLEPVHGDDNLAHLLIDDAIGALGMASVRSLMNLIRVLDDVPDVRRRSPRLGEVRGARPGSAPRSVHRGSGGGGRRRPRRDPTFGRSGSCRTNTTRCRDRARRDRRPEPRQPRGRRTPTAAVDAILFQRLASAESPRVRRRGFRVG